VFIHTINKLASKKLIYYKNKKCENSNRIKQGNSVIMFNVKDVEIQNLDHLGIIAGIVDSIN
jgi:hypothetical protein